LERLEQRDLHVPDRRRPERVAEHLLQLHACSFTQTCAWACMLMHAMRSHVPGGRGAMGY
jgi:hypothetical protein